MASESVPAVPPSRSDAASPRPAFDAEPLRAYIKKLLPSTLHAATWPEKDRDRVKAWTHDIGDRVKLRCLEIEPEAFKYIVLTQIFENRGQGCRADMTCHWHDSDAVVQEMYTTDALVCICITFAIA